MPVSRRTRTRCACLLPLLAGWFLVACGAQTPDSVGGAAADTVYWGGTVYTADPDQPWAEALAVKDGAIVFVGSSDEVRTRYLSASQVDLGGRFVLPGLIDAHAHPGLVALIGEIDETESILAQTTKEDLFASLRALAEQTGDEPFVIAGEWDVAMFLPDGPEKADLDEIFGERPVILFDNSGHSTWLSSAALAMFGVDSDTPDLSSGVSVFAGDENGEPTGWVKEFALMYAMAESLLRPEEEIRERIGYYLRYLSAHGVTTLWDAGNFVLDDEIYAVLAALDRAGELPVRYEGSYHIFDPAQIEMAVEELLRLRHEYEGENLGFRSIKVHYDGVVEIGTAGMLHPYLIGPAENRGGYLFSSERLAEFLLELEGHDIDLHLHSVGDGATREILDGVELARSSKGGPLGIEVTISHLEHVDDGDKPRFAELDVHANLTPHWWGGTYFGRAGEMFVGSEEIERSQPAKDLFRLGANVTLSSDVTTLSAHHRANPFLGIQMSLTRQEFEGGPEAPVFGPEKGRLTLEEAIAGYTLNGARQLGRESDLGSLAVGKRADFVVLDRSLFETDTYEVKDLEPVAVYLDGVLVAGAGFGFQAQKSTGAGNEIERPAASEALLQEATTALQNRLDELCKEHGFIGATAAFVLPSRARLHSAWLPTDCSVSTI